MKLATLSDGSRDGRLHVVHPSGNTVVDAGHIAPSLQHALDRWDIVCEPLTALAQLLEADQAAGTPLDASRLLPPLPRAYEWLDGSAYLSHVARVRKARNAEPPATLLTDPLVYQGGSGVLLSARDKLVLPDEAWGLDFEGELCAVLGDTPMGTRAEQAAAHIRLFMLINDVTYRNLIPSELAKGFGFVQAKPATAFSPFAITPDEFGASYREGRVHLSLQCHLNTQKLGDPDASEMHFSFFDLIAHITKTRSFTAGTLLGSGTVSNHDEARGITCLAELRAIETILHGAPRTPYLKSGDRVRFDMLDEDGRSLFGAIEQEVEALP